MFMMYKNLLTEIYRISELMNISGSQLIVESYTKNLFRKIEQNISKYIDREGEIAAERFLAQDSRAFEVRLKDFLGNLLNKATNSAAEIKLFKQFNTAMIESSTKYREQVIEDLMPNLLGMEKTSGLAKVKEFLDLNFGTKSFDVFERLKGKGVTPLPPTPKTEVVIPTLLKDKEGVKKFQNWLNDNYPTWNAGGKLEDGSQLFGTYGPNTERAFEQYSKDYEKFLDMKKLEQNYVAINYRIEPEPIKKTESPTQGVSLSPETENKINSNISNANYTNPYYVENFLKKLFNNKNKESEEGKIKSKIIDFFKYVFENNVPEDAYQHWSAIFDKDKLKQIETMLDLLEQKFKNRKIYYGDGTNPISFEQFRNDILKNDKLLVKDEGGILKFSQLNKLDTNFNDNSRVLMDWAKGLSEKEFERFKIISNLYIKGEIAYSEYEKELDYVLNELKKDKSYPEQWFRVIKDKREPDWFIQNIMKNTQTGDNSEQKILSILKSVGLEHELEIEGVGKIPLTAMEGSPVDRLLNIDGIVKDTRGLFGGQNNFLTLQTKSVSGLKFNPSINGYEFYGIKKISKTSMIDIVGFVDRDRYIIFEKKDKKFLQPHPFIKGAFYIPENQVKLTNIQ